MKKKIALLLVACLTVASLAVACGSKEEEKETTTKATTTEAESTTEEPTTEEPTTEAYDDTKVEATGWWVNHSKAFEITADGITVTFKSVTDAAATSNWNTPIYVVYGADEAFAGGAGISNVAGYSELLVMRSDNYGWAPDNINGTTGVVNTGATAETDNWTVAGYAITSEGVPADDAAWATWLEANKAGVTVTVTAKLDGDNAVVTMDNNGVKTTTTIPVKNVGKTVYLSLGGELCTLTEIAAQ